MIRRSVAALVEPSQLTSSVQWLVHRELIPDSLGMLMVQVLAEGDELAAHSLPAESATFVLSGQGDWPAGAAAWSLSPGDGVFNAPGTCRGFAPAPGQRSVLLTAFGGTADPRDATPGPHPAARVPCGCRIARAADRANSALAAAGGFIDMGVHWLATSDTVGTRRVVVATSTFTPGGSHQLHRHPRADEFFLVMQGSGEHLTEHGPVRLGPGDLAYIPANEWHGYRTDPGVTTVTIYGYLGAGSLDHAGYELRTEDA